MADINNHLNPEINEDLTIIFEEVESKNSIKTNWLITNRNFKKLRLLLNSLIAYVVELNNKIKPEEITENVIDNLSKNKPNISINVSMNNNQPKIENGFIVTKIEDDTYRIIRQESSNQWSTDLLIVQAKETESGIRLFPVVTGKGNELVIYFVDGIHTNVTIFWI